MKLGRFAIAAALTSATSAYAGVREEAAAKAALQRAVAEHHGHHYARALEMLSRAEKACEPDKCSPGTLAALLRDVGTMQLLDGEEDKARSNFSAALSFDPSVDLNPAYDASDVRAIWNELKSPGSSSSSSQPSGDFEHTPAAAQKKGVPLPVYVEYHGTAHPASIVVRYAASGSSDYRRMQLVRVGHGWGAVIPCGATKLGALRYYFQGLDSDGLPILDGGDKRHPYSVPITPTLDGPKPHLPGHRAPTTCGEGLDEEEAEARAPASDATSETTVPTRTGPATYSRVWIGISGALDITVLPAGTDVCARDSSTANGASIDPNWSCTSNTPEGADFPNGKTENGSLAQGNAGVVDGGIQPANVRIKATLDFALTPNVLLGVAIGYVAGSYSGNVSAKFIPLHAEARATLIFGSEPLMRSGFNVYTQLAGGVGEYDANITIRVAQTNVAGARPVQAWHVGGPGFVALEAGVRYAFSPRAAFSLGIRGTTAFGASFFPAFGPDVSLQFGL